MLILPDVDDEAPLLPFVEKIVISKGKENSPFPPASYDGSQFFAGADESSGRDDYTDDDYFVDDSDGPNFWIYDTYLSD
jgi:hypothetical protein